MVGPAIYSGTPTAGTALLMNCPFSTTAYGQFYPISPIKGRKYIGITGRILGTSNTAGATLSLAPATILMGGATPTRDTTRTNSLPADVVGPYTFLFATPIVLQSHLLGVSFIASAAAAIDFDATMILSA